MLLTDDLVHDYMGAELSDDELADLTEYVRELPGDRLYLNSARPLDGEEHVYFETDIQLVFSDSIAPGQVGHFSALLAGEPPEPFPGEWTLSGRYARFRILDMSRFMWKATAGIFITRLTHSVLVPGVLSLRDRMVFR